MLALTVALTLGACASDGARQASDVGDPQRVDQPGEASGADPVARFVLGANPGDSAVLTLGDGRRVRVTVGATYTSAARLRCRRITLQSERDASRVSAVCLEDGQWETVLDP